MTIVKRFAELRTRLGNQTWPELRPLLLQPFTKVERALTLAGIAPALLVGAAVHDPSRLAFPLPDGAVAAAEIAAPVPPLPSAPPPQSLVSELDALTARFGGTVGIAVTSLDDNWIVRHNGSLKLPQQSVSKLWVTMTVLDQVDQGKISLTDQVTITKADFTLFHQPIAALVKDDTGYTASVGELIRRAMQMSDNTCNDKLLRLAGGPSAVRAFIAKKGLGAIRFGPGEKLLQAATAGLTWKPEYSMGNAFAVARAKLPAAIRVAAFDAYVGDPPDGAAPEAIAMALSRLKKGELLSPDSTRWLLDTMAGAKTGRARVHAAVPAGWEYAHKTGTGQDLGGRTAGFNDVGILTAPDGKTYALAIMIGDYAGPIQNRQLLMQAVAKAVVATHP